MAEVVRVAQIEAPEGEIELGQVERALAGLWAAAAPRDPGAEQAVLRACSLNLLVLCESPEELERVRPIAARTTLARPSRILLLAAEQSVFGVRSSVFGSVGPSTEHRTPNTEHRTPNTAAPASTGARISTFCHRLGGGGRHVCCEEITVLARGAAAERLREVALPLLLPDLPVFLWVPGVRREAPGVSGRAAGTVAHASRLTPHASPGVWELADAVVWSERGVEEELPVNGAASRRPAVVDLDWQRLGPWRELTAQIFDPPACRSLLPCISGVEIVVSGPAAPHPGAGWLWVGWLASRLGWEYRGEAMGPEERRLHGPAGSITARVRVQDVSDAGPGEPLAVRLSVEGSAEPLVLERQVAQEPGHLWIAVRGGRCIHLGERDEAVLLAEALGSTTRNRVYEAARELALRLWR